MGNVSDFLCAPGRDLKKGVSRNGEQQMGFSEQHLSKGVCFTRCNFSPVGLTSSSEGFETCTAACLLLSYHQTHKALSERVRTFIIPAQAKKA